MAFDMHLEGTGPDLVERVTAEMLDWMEDVVAIRALQTATRRPDLVRGLVVSHPPSERRGPASESRSVGRASRPVSVAKRVTLVKQTEEGRARHSLLGAAVSGLCSRHLSLLPPRNLATGGKHGVVLRAHEHVMQLAAPNTLVPSVV